MNGWQPIESAPHEELVVLGWWEAFPVSSVPDPDFVWKQEIGFASAGQRFAIGYSNRWEHGQATHWQPLPPAPGGPAPETADERQAAIVAALRERHEIGQSDRSIARWIESGEWRR